MCVCVCVRERESTKRHLKYVCTSHVHCQSNLPKTIHEGTFLAEVSRDFYESTVRDGSEISIGRRDSGIIDAVVV